MRLTTYLFLCALLLLCGSSCKKSTPTTAAVTCSTHTNDLEKARTWHDTTQSQFYDSGWQHAVVFSTTAPEIHVVNSCKIYVSPDTLKFSKLDTVNKCFVFGGGSGGGDVLYFYYLKDSIYFTRFLGSELGNWSYTHMSSP